MDWEAEMDLLQKRIKQSQSSDYCEKLLRQLLRLYTRTHKGKEQNSVKESLEQKQKGKEKGKGADKEQAKEPLPSELSLEHYKLFFQFLILTSFSSD
jgi:hypothetical protein